MATVPRGSTLAGGLWMFLSSSSSVTTGTSEFGELALRADRPL